MNNILNPLKNWIPYKVTYNDCHWLNTFDKPFTEPFFDETITACKSLPQQNRQFASVSDLDMLINWSQSLDHVKPTAFIFHVSRCGSTLVSQLLGMDSRNISLAEVPFLDDILRLSYKNASYNSLDSERLFEAALRFYGQKRNGDEQHLFVKTDSWHILFHKQLRKLYPDVPFILLYRSPNEVLNSHIKQRGIQAVPGLLEPELFGFDPQQVLNTPLNNYMVNVLERYFSLYLEVAENDKLSLLLNYNEGIMPMIDKVAAFSNIHIGQAELLQMKERSGYHSKHPTQLFSETQPHNVPDYLRDVFSLYHQTEAKRLTMQYV